MPETDIAGAPDLVALLASADSIADAAGDAQTGTEHVLFALLRHPARIPVDRLHALGMEPDILFARLAELAKRCTPAPPAARL
ncbi:Clp protease N-terminal domain-containing protein [Nocardia sp. NPDC057668]|uniref:Clp protease N-terminal domain-containing protein n=1 Tax=Nocardia sp. NPDC057668 TaxID=3346202 RepID=UPI00366C5034